MPLNLLYSGIFMLLKARHNRSNTAIIMRKVIIECNNKQPHKSQYDLSTGGGAEIATKIKYKL